MISLLYVDDESQLLDIAKMFLERTREFSVDMETSAKTGMELLKSRSYDAIVSDYQMPEMDGIEFLKQVRSIYGDLPFILFTGRGREEVVIEAINNGADFYLQKGGDPKSQFAELAHKVRHAIRRRQAERALKESEARFRGMAERSSDLILVLDDTFSPVFVSPSVTRILGYLPEEVLGQPLDTSVMPQSDIDLVHMMTARSPDNVVGREIELHFTKKDGTTAIMAAHGVPILKDGILNGFQVHARDITGRKAAEIALQKSEARFREMAERSSDLIIVADERNYPTFVSPSIKTILGFEPVEVIGKDPSGLLFDREEFARLVDLSENVGGNDAIRHIDLRFLKKDGTSALLETRGQPFVLDGKFVGVQVQARDVTERRRMENALRESEKAYRAVFEHTGSAMIQVEEDTTISLANDTFEQVTGYSRHEIEGKRKWTEFVVKDDLDKMVRYHQERRQGGSQAPMTYEFRLVHKDGSIRNILLTVGKIPDTKRTVASLIDLTETKQMERTLKESEEHFRTLVENAPEAINITADDRFVYVNSAFVRLLGASSADQLIGRCPLDFIHPSLHTVVAERVKCLTHDLEAVNLLDEIYLRIDGTPVDVEVTAAPFRVGGINGTLGFIRDISGRKRMEETLHAQVEELKKRKAALEVSERRYRRLLEHTFDAMFVHRDGVIVDANQAAAQVLRASTPEDLVGRRVLDLVHQDYRDLALERIQQVQNNPDVVAPLIEEKYLRTDGMPIDVEVVGTQIEYKGSPAVQVIFREIPRRKGIKKKEKKG